MIDGKGSKRRERPIRLVVEWHGRTINNRREAVCWTCIYDMRRGQRHAMSFVLSMTELEQAFVRSDWTGFFITVSHRYRRTMQMLREHWRNEALGAGWRNRKAERYHAKFMEGWKTGDGKIECSFCGGLHLFDRSLKGDGVVRWTCEGRVLAQPAFTVVIRSARALPA